MKNKIFTLLTFLIIFFVLITANDLVAQLIFYFGLSIIGLFIFKFLHLISDKLNSIINKGRNNDEESKRQ